MPEPLAVVAIGGNALAGPGEAADAATQRRNLRRVVPPLAALARTHRLTITHGNGPQVGRLAAREPRDDADPLDVLDAETAGAIGYLLCEALDAAGASPTVSMLTRVVVHPDDPAFATPTKPIGPRVALAEAEALATARGWTFRHDGADARRVVASPEPRAIVEVEAIRELVARGTTVVCAGGGGIPVLVTTGAHPGIEAVVDKDLSSALLAIELDADLLVILTDVDAVRLDFGGANERRIRSAAPEALASRAFAPGSMGPKVLAACRFVEATGSPAVIAALGELRDALAGRRGTHVSRDAPWRTEPSGEVQR